jgi:hypothetical protein
MRRAWITIAIVLGFVAIGLLTDGRALWERVLLSAGAVGFLLWAGYSVGRGAPP